MNPVSAQSAPNQSGVRITITDKILSAVIAVIAGLFTAYGVYYNMVATQKQQGIQVDENTKGIKELKEATNAIYVYQAGNTEQLKSLEGQMTDVKKTQERIEDKIDKLLFKDK